MAVVKNLMVRAGADFSGLNKGLRQAQQQVQQFGNSVSATMSKVQTALMALGAGITIGTGIKDAVKVEGAILSLNRLLGQNSQEFLYWANTQSQAFGMSKAEAIDYGKTYASLLSTFSTDTKQTLTMTQDLLKASAVVASMSGRSMTDVMERIRSGLLGNTEAIEDLGINVNVAMIESTNAFKQFANGKSWQQLSFQVQQQIRYYAILEQASKKFGTEVGDTTGLKLAQFTASLSNLRLALGNAFIPILNVVLPILTRFVNALATGMEYVSAFVRALFGYSKQSKAVADTSKQVASVNAGYEDTTDSIKSAAKAQKGFLAGFDEINSVPDSKADAGAGGGGASAPAMAVAPPDTSGFETPFDNVAASAERMAKRVKDAWANIRAKIIEHKEIIIAVIGGIVFAYGSYAIATKGAAAATTVFNRALKAVQATLAIMAAPAAIIAVVIGVLVASFIYFYQTNEKFRGVVDGILLQIGNMAIWLWENVLVPFASWLSVALPIAWDAVKNSVMFLWQNVLVPLGTFLGTAFVIAWNIISQILIFLWKEVLVPLINILKLLYVTIIQPLAKLLIGVLAVAIKFVTAMFISLWNNALKPIVISLGSALYPAIEAIITVFVFLWKFVLRPFIEFLLTVFIKSIGVVINVLTFLWKNVMKPLVSFAEENLLPVFDTVFGGMGDIVSGLIDTFKGLMKFITGVFTGDWKKAWTGVKDIFKGIFDTLWGIVKVPFNLIIDGINVVIGALNSLSIEIPSWVPYYGGDTWGVDIPKIPKLARGGIVSSPTMAMIGEAGSEMVVPLENTSFVDKLASSLGSAVMAAMQMSNGDTGMNGNKELVIQIDGNTIAKVLNPYTTRESNRVGSSLITVI